VMLSESTTAQITAHARAKQQSRSEYIRAAVIEKLAKEEGGK